ncbi:MAG: lipoate--protein ligase [Ruminococcaceae bacterium]|nr:lipoate--protein ligase [Oscillospiraceae bacterium]
MIEKLLVYRSNCVDPYFNIATEKLLLESVSPGECILYLWQNQNTVVIGRNQNAWAECRTSLLEEEGGKLARRLSGGGAVFHDVGNLNFTFLVRDEDYDVDRQLSVIQAALEELGLQAEKSGRNDLLVQGQKFSGNAYYHHQGRSYHHGTLLIDADMEKLSRYLTPSKAKLEAKGVSSVRSRVTNLKALIPDLSCEVMAEHMQTAFAKIYGHTLKQITLSDTDISTIEANAAQLGSWQWLYGPRIPFSFCCEDRFPWGSISLQLQVESGLIQKAQVYSDAMDFTIAQAVSGALTNCRFVYKDMQKALTAALHDQIACHDICKLLSQQNL